MADVAVVGVNDCANFDEDAPDIDAFADGENNGRFESLPKSERKNKTKIEWPEIIISLTTNIAINLLLNEIPINYECATDRRCETMSNESLYLF